MRFKIRRLLLTSALLLRLLGAAVLSSGTAPAAGRYLHGTGESHILIDRKGTPCILEDRSPGGTLFSGLADGDRVLVVRGPNVSQVYPARAEAYLLLNLGGGSGSLPRDTLDQLAQLSWLPAASL